MGNALLNSKNGAAPIADTDQANYSITPLRPTLTEGDLILLRPRAVKFPVPGGTALPAGTPIEGPYIRLTPAKQAVLVPGPLGDLPACRPDAQNITQKNDFADVNGIARMAVSEDMPDGLYYELDALCNVPIAMPFNGSASLATAICRATMFDCYSWTPGRAMGVWAPRTGQKLSYRQTRNVQPTVTRTVNVPLGAYAFELLLDGRAAQPIITLGYEDTTQAGPPATLQTLDFTGTAYIMGTVISLAGARNVKVANAGAGDVRLVFHIAMI